MPTNRGSSTSPSRRARLTARGLIWRSRPTSCQAWLRVSNIFGGVLGIGMSLANDGARTQRYASLTDLLYPSGAMSSNLRRLIIPVALLGVLLIVVAVIYF